MLSAQAPLSLRDAEYLNGPAVLSLVGPGGDPEQPGDFSEVVNS